MWCRMLMKPICAPSRLGFQFATELEQLYSRLTGRSIARKSVGETVWWPFRCRYPSRSRRNPGIRSG